MNAREEAIEQRLRIPLVIAALAIIPILGIEQSDLGEPWMTVADVMNWIAWGVFVGEAITMLVVVDDRWGWIRHHPLLVAIIVLTPPWFGGLALARLLRLALLVRGTWLFRRVLTPEGVRDAGFLAVLTVLVGGIAFAWVESPQPDGRQLSSFDGIWWAATTVTTVGYGDIVPHTGWGRIIGVVVIVAGIGFVAVLTAAAASRFTNSQAAAALADGAQAPAPDAVAQELAAVSRQLTEVAERLTAIETRLDGGNGPPPLGPPPSRPDSPLV